MPASERGSRVRDATLCPKGSTPHATVHHPARQERGRRFEPLVDGGLDPVIVDQDRFDREVGRELEFVQGAGVGRVGDADVQPAAALEQRHRGVLADELLVDQLDRRLVGVHRAQVEDRHAELDRIGGGQLDRRHQLVLDQVQGQRLARLGGAGHRLARGVLGEHAVHDEAPGDAGDADQVGVRSGGQGATLK
jgi:hypothetical protein